VVSCERCTGENGAPFDGRCRRSGRRAWDGTRPALRHCTALAAFHEVPRAADQELELVPAWPTQRLPAASNSCFHVARDGFGAPDVDQPVVAGAPRFVLVVGDYRRRL